MGKQTTLPHYFIHNIKTMFLVMDWLEFHVEPEIVRIETLTASVLTINVSHDISL
jgi:hypothetical protein